MDNNLQIKTYLYKMTPEFHKAIVNTAAKNQMTLHDFFTVAIQNMMAESEGK